MIGLFRMTINAKSDKIPHAVIIFQSIFMMHMKFFLLASADRSAPHF